MDSTLNTYERNILLHFPSFAIIREMYGKLCRYFGYLYISVPLIHCVRIPIHGQWVVSLGGSTVYDHWGTLMFRGCLAWEHWSGKYRCQQLQVPSTTCPSTATAKLALEGGAPLSARKLQAPSSLTTAMPLVENHVWVCWHCWGHNKNRQCCCLDQILLKGSHCRPLLPPAGAFICSVRGHNFMVQDRNR